MALATSTGPTPTTPSSATAVPAARSRSTSAINLDTGSFQLINTTAGVNRVPDAAAMSSTNGSTITFNKKSGANVYAETLGTISPNSGQLNIVATNTQSSTGSQTLTLGGMTRNGATSTVLFASCGGLNTTKNVIVVGGPPP